MDVTLPELVQLFQEETEAQFNFLVDKHGCSNDSGLSNFSGPVPSLKKPVLDRLPGLFWLVERFSKDEIRFEIAYGDRELIVEGDWWFEDQTHGFGMWEILAAAKIHDRDIGGRSWVNSFELMERTISNMASSLKRNIDVFLNPPREIIDRALEVRGHRLRYDREKQKIRDLNRARVVAAEAFRRKDYHQVIELLSSFEDILSAADKKKVRLSKKYARNI